MKVDKETLIKQRFWILLGTIVPLVLIAWLVLSFGVSDTIAKERTAYETSKKALENIRSPKNDKFVDELEKKRRELEGQKDVVWRDAWKVQDSMMTWPRFNEANLQDRLMKKGYFGDDIPDPERRNFAATIYGEQIKEAFKDIIYPVEYKGGWESLLTYVGKSDSKAGKFKVSPPSVEECWLAQEDLWVQRELLTIVKAVLEEVAKFKKVEPAPKDPLPKDALAQYRLRNPQWEVNLVLKQNDKRQMSIAPESTIKNINAGKRTLLLGRGNQRGVKLRIRQYNAQGTLVAGPTDVEIQGTPVAWGQSVPVNARPDRIDEAFDPKLPITVEQVFDWYTSPVKRVDDVHLSKHSHRLANFAFVPSKISKPAEGEADKAADAATGGSGMGAGGMAMGGAGMGGGGFGAAGAANKPKTETPNGLEKNRYLEVTDQVRRMPVGLLVVVDQAYIPDVLTAFSNSRLRIQTTQVHWQHVNGIRPTLEDSSSETPAGTGVAGGGDVRPGAGIGSAPPGIGSAPPGVGSAPPPRGTAGGGGMRPPMGVGSAPGSMPPATGVAPPRGAFGAAGGRPGMVPPAAAGAGAGAFGGTGGEMTSIPDEDDPNLVELAVYGIASLYERFPANKASADGATATDKK